MWKRCEELLDKQGHPTVCDERVERIQHHNRRVDGKAGTVVDDCECQLLVDLAVKNPNVS